MSVDDKYRQWADDDPENMVNWQQYQGWKAKRGQKMKLQNNCVRCELCGGEAEIEQITTDSWFLGIVSIYAKCVICGKMWEKIVELDDFDEYEEVKDEREI